MDGDIRRRVNSRHDGECVKEKMIGRTIGRGKYHVGVMKSSDIIRVLVRRRANPI